jgi:hypothetical protein
MIIALFLAASPIAAAPSTTLPELFGLTIGRPMPFAECPEATQPNGKPRKRGKYWQWIYDGAGSAGAPCFQRRVKKGSSEPFDPIESVEVEYPEALKIAGTGRLGVMMVNGKVAAVGMATSGESSQETNLATLTAKFGPPSMISREPMQNGFGAKFARVNAIWDFGRGVQGQFLGFRDKLTEGAFGINTPESLAEHERQLQKLRNLGRDL